MSFVIALFSMAIGFAAAMLMSVTAERLLRSKLVERDRRVAEELDEIDAMLKSLALKRPLRAGAEEDGGALMSGAMNYIMKSRSRDAALKTIDKIAYVLGPQGKDFELSSRKIIDQRLPARGLRETAATR